MIELHWKLSTGQLTATRPNVDGTCADIVVPTELATGRALVLTDVLGVSADARMALLRRFGE